jgi:hypothetical protein
VDTITNLAIYSTPPHTAATKRSSCLAVILAQESSEPFVTFDDSAGYASGCEERIPGGADLAVPVYGNDDSMVFFLALSMPSNRFDPKRLPQFLKWIKTAASEISARL